jgi:transposase InsO family protein
MRAEGIQGAKRRGKPWRTTTPDPDARRRPDLVNRDFTASAPNELWVADFSYLRCWEGVVFFSFVIDVYSRKVVGWQFARHMRTTLVLDALRMALSTRKRVEEVRLTRDLPATRPEPRRPWRRAPEQSREDHEPARAGDPARSVSVSVSSR